MTSHRTIVLASVLLVCSSALPQIYRRPTIDRCTTPEDQDGQCIPLEKCDHLLHLIGTRRASLNLVRAFTCGFSGSSPKVCCPLQVSIEDQDAEFRGTGAGNPEEQGNENKEGDKTNSTELTRTGESNGDDSKTTTENTNKQVTTATIKPVTNPPIENNTVLTLDDMLPSDCGVSYAIFKIFGGVTSDPRAWPWLAVLQYKDKRGRKYFACGGTLINKYFVLTAAHCVIGKNGFREVSMVRLGDHNLARDDDDASPQDFFPTKLIPHEEYALRSQHYNDIALIKLNRAVEFGEFISPICLPLSTFPLDQESMKSTILTVAGWGSNGTHRSSDTLQQVDIRLVPQDLCGAHFQKFGINLKETQMCAGEEGKDSCRGDSGGPLMFADLETGRYRIAGVVSLGSRQCGNGIPGIYTVVSHYREWIVNTLTREMLS